MTENSFYTAEDQVLAELDFRRKKTTLCGQVTDLLGEDIPCCLDEQPCAVLFRHIATPDMEMVRFVKTAERLNLLPLVIEFSADKFVSRNRDKMKLGKLCFSELRADGKEYQYRYHKIFNPAEVENQLLKEITTTTGEKLVDFHHKWLRQIFPQVVHCDVSEWILRHGTHAQEFYRSFFCLFVAHGVLFDTFLEDDSEGPFTNRVIRPAFDEVTSRFGKRPLIVELFSQDEWGQKVWWSYPASHNFF